MPSHFLMSDVDASDGALFTMAHIIKILDNDQDTALSDFVTEGRGARPSFVLHGY
jgi:hypothetical protein